MAVAAVSAWASWSGGQVAGPARPAPGRGVVVGDGGGGGQRLGQERLLVGGQVRGQPGQRLGAGESSVMAVAAVERLGQDGGPLAGRWGASPVSAWARG